MTPAEIRTALEQAAKRIRFSAKAHRYWLDDKPVGGVTTICKMLYRPQLEHWKIKQQARGTAKACVEFPIQPGEDVELYADRMLKEAVKLLEGERVAQQAADVGNALHALIEWWCRQQIDQPTDRPVVGDHGEALFDQWMTWALAEKFEVVAVEQPVLYSVEGMRYAGRIDLLAFVKGRLAVCDWKSKATAGVLWPDQRMQNVAYRNALEKTIGVASEGLIVVVPRDGGAVTPIPVEGDLVGDWQAFRACYQLWEWSK